jgi:hypothetical protein
MISGARTRLRCDTGRTITADSPVMGKISRPASSGDRPRPASSHWVSPYKTV